MKAYAKTERGRKVLQAIKDRNKIKYPKKVQARKIVAYALAIGYLVKSETCSSCDRKTKPHGHHPDYDKALEVIWLCGSCHLTLHNIDK